MTTDDSGDRTALAGEYVLGLLAPDAQAQAERQMAADAALRAEIYQWQDRLLPLVAQVAPAQPDASLWNAIAARLHAPASASAPTGWPGTGNAPAANDPLWRKLRRWQLAGGFGVAASVVLAALLLLRQPAPEPTRYLTLLQVPGTQQTGWVVESTAGDRIRLVPVGAVDAVPAGKALQFWTKPQGAADPTSLGLVRPGNALVLPAARSPGIGEQQLFELTLEDDTGSATGKPTGPILYVGRSVRL